MSECCGPGVVDAAALRSAMGRFVTGVAVVTAVATDGRPHGMTVNSLTSVCLDPPLILVCLTRGARTTDAVLESGRFAVSVLAARHESIARRFAGPGEDHFLGLDPQQGGHEVPVVPRALAHLECAVDRLVEAGDHAVVFGAVERACDGDGDPLAFLAGRFGGYADHGHPPVPWFS